MAGRAVVDGSCVTCPPPEGKRPGSVVHLIYLATIVYQEQPKQICAVHGTVSDARVKCIA